MQDKKDIDIWTTSSGRPNLHPFSLLVTAVAILAFLFLPPKVGGALAAFAIIWWVCILPLAIILTGGAVWDPARTEEGNWGRRDP